MKTIRFFDLTNSKPEFLHQNLMVGLIFFFIRQCAGKGSTRWKLKTVCPVNTKGQPVGLQLEIENSQDVIQGQKRSPNARNDI